MPHKPKVTVASLKRQLKKQQLATAQRQDLLNHTEAELQTALDNQLRLNRELKESREAQLATHTQQGHMQRRLESNAEVIATQGSVIDAYHVNGFVVEVTIKRGAALKQTSTYEFVKGAHSLNLIVDSGGSVRGVLGDIADMRAETAHEPLHIHRQESLNDVMTQPSV